MGSIAGDDVGSVGGGKEERILVSVRIRPLNGKEIERNDPSDWECINNNTVIFKNSLPDRAMYPGAYTFDRVFGSDSTTKQVYEEGAREVALSVISGINSSIFAYGQTSSGKTYTMTGITEYSVSEIYDYIYKHSEREFVLKFSAIEIYNEAVKDLLNPDSGQLRLLDDPEKGTIVEKLTEETLRDQAHLEELLSFCGVQRQIGETSLNEMSSRSHQILKLSIESLAREFSGKDNFSTLMATVNFVDLAGSERASQALTAGSRLKEGCHINRSLLALGTVIRKLSKARHGGHVPYRDSKLTRILQSSLGGNARTAIICTMSPARTHIEQSRNTLQFASCAKEVVTSAHVNVVMSDKALAKHLWKELARLENELRYMGPASGSRPSNVLREKEAQIKQMEQEMKELTKQRDLAQSRLEDLLKSVGDDQALGQWEELSHMSMPYVFNPYEDTLSLSGVSGVSYQTPERGITMGAESDVLSDCTEHQPQISGRQEEQHVGSAPYHSESTPTSMRQEEISPSTSPDLQHHCKEVRCFEMIEPSLNKTKDFDTLLTQEIDSLLSPTADIKDAVKETGETENTLEETVDAKDTPKETVDTKEQDHEPRTKGETWLNIKSSLLPPARYLNSSSCLQLVRTRSCRATLIPSGSSPWFEDVDEYKSTPPNDFLKDFTGGPRKSQKSISAIIYGDEQERHLRDGSDDSNEKSTSNDVLKPQNVQTSQDGSITRISSNSVGHLEEMMHIEFQKGLASDQEQEYNANKDSDIKITINDVCLESMLKSSESPSDWRLEFEKKQREIVELWHACHVSLIHRSCFFLLIKGDPTDSIYMEVELRRLSFIKKSSQGTVDKTIVGENVWQELSLKSIRRERGRLAKLMKRLPAAERDSLYTKWGIALDSKQRRQQVARKLWTDTKDMEQVRESAIVVAKLFGFLEPERVPKEMFGLCFTPQLASRRSFNWKYGVFP